MNGYIAFFNGRQVEVHAETMWDAKQKAVALLKPKRSQQHMVSVVLAEFVGDQVTHNPAILPGS